MSETAKSDVPISNSVVLIGILLAAFNLRPAIASVSPLLEVIRSDTGLSYAAISLLTSVPVFCMGIFALATPTVTRLVGRERGLFWGIGLIGFATAGRVAGDNSIVLIATTVLVGIGIAISQTLLPPLISVYFPRRVAFATGLYTASLSAGAAIATAVTGPLRAVVGSWTTALALWALLAGVALLAWLPVLRSRPRRRTDSMVDRRLFEAISWTDRDVWMMIGVLGGGNTIFYSTLTWLAPRYVALGWSENASGFLLTAFLVSQVGGMLAVSAFADRLFDRRTWLGGALVLTAVGAIGVALRPEVLPWGIAAVFGTGAGGLFALALTLPVDFAAGDDTAGQLSTVVMCGGYLIGAVGPFVIGLSRDAGGGYPTTFGGMAVLCLGLLVVATRLTPE